MTMTTTRLLPHALIAALALAAAAAFAASADAQTEAVEEEPYIAVVTQDGVFIRSGAARAYYPLGTVDTGDLVKVTGKRYGFARVAPVGPAFADLYGHVITPRGKRSPLRIQPNSRSAITLGRVEVFAPNLDYDYRPKDSWKRITTIEADQPVTILETIEDEISTVHKVELPIDSITWIHTRFLRPAEAEEIAAWEQAMAAPPEPEPEPLRTDQAEAEDVAIDQSVLARDEERLPPVEAGQEPTGAAPPDTSADEPIAGRPEEIQMGDETAAPPSDQHLAQAPPTMPSPEPAEPQPPTRDEVVLHDLERAFEALKQEPIETAEVRPLRKLYLDLAERYKDNATIQHFATTRAEQLAIWAEIQRRKAELAETRARVELAGEETRAVRLALDSAAEYVAIGRLSASTIYDGKRLPRLLRLVEPGTGRTIAYLEPARDFDLLNMLGQVIGVVGRKEYDGGLALNLLKPSRIDILRPQD